MILNNYFVSLAITIFTSSVLTLENECAALDKSIEYLCKTLNHYFKHDNGNLGKHTCGCITTLFNGDYNHCNAHDYDFPDAPNCALVFKSETFKRVSNGNPSKFSKYLVDVIAKNVFNICVEPNEDLIVNSMFMAYNNPVIITTIESAGRYLLDSDFAEPLINCYRDFQRLAKDHIENLLIPPHLLDEL